MTITDSSPKWRGTHSALRASHRAGGTRPPQCPASGALHALKAAISAAQASGGATTAAVPLYSWHCAVPLAVLQSIQASY